MNSEAIESCVEALERVFEVEAEHIIRGQLIEIGELSSAKFAHIGELTKAVESGALRNQSESMVRRVQQLQSTADEHGRHLLAMQRGLQQALDRLDRLQSDSQVGSYDQSGSRVQFSGARGRFESKA